MKIKSKLAALAAGMSLSVSALAVPITTDIISVVDISGSMATEHAWLGGMVLGLDAALTTEAGTDPISTQYGLTGFGGRGARLNGHQYDVGGDEFGNAAEYDVATNALPTSGGFEDGYEAMNFALNNYTLRSDAVTNIILVSDEDRDVGNSITYTSMLAELDSFSALVNAVINVSFQCGDGTTALGMDATGTGYVADGNGGYTSCSGATATGGFGTSINDYANLALATGGAAWDLNQLRAGGLTADSFTLAFTDIKVEETVDNTPPTSVPEPAPLALLGIGLIALRLTRRKLA